MKGIYILVPVVIAFFFSSSMLVREDHHKFITEAENRLPMVFPGNHADLVYSRLRNEAFARFSIHQLPANLIEWESYRTWLRNEIIEKTGFVIDHELPIDMRVTVTIPMPGYKIKNIYFQTKPGIYATANLYIPEGKGPFPGVIVMAGHSSNGRIYDFYQAIGHTLALNGYVALSIDPWGAGERTTIHGEFEYHGANLGASLMNIGESLMGVQINDNMRGVDLLLSLPNVDRDNIGATGASGGGNQTMWLAAIDERVKAAIPVVSVGTFESYIMRSNCICETLVDGLTFTEQSGVLALARAIMPINIERDNPAFLASEMVRSYENAKPVFNMKSAGDDISYRTFDLTHEYHPEIRQTMLGWFDLKLKGIGTGDAKKEIPFEIVPSEKLMTFSSGKRDPKVINTEEYCKRIGGELRNDYLDKNSFNAGEKRKELLNILRVNEKPELEEVHRYTIINGWERFILKTSDGKLIPVLHLAPVNNSMDYVIFSDPSRKNNIPVDIINGIKAKGDGLVIVDLSGTGEASSEADSRGRVLHTIARAELWLGKTLMGEWVKELDIVAGFIRSEFNVQKISLDGSKETGLAGLFLGATQGNIDEIILRDAPISYLFDNRNNIDFFSMAIHLPGFLNWGDISLAAALSGSKITFIRPLTMSGHPVSGKGLSEFESEFVRINDICKQPGKTIFN